MHKMFDDQSFWAAVGVVMAILGVVGTATAKWLSRITRAVDRLESGQAGMQTDIQEIRAEFPKNGIPTRAVIDVIRKDVADLKTDVISNKTGYEAHLTMLHDQRPK